ncbi:hypothetical protein GJ496_006042, partial [Pomphorhynchus laevis]
MYSLSQSSNCMFAIMRQTVNIEDLKSMKSQNEHKIRNTRNATFGNSYLPFTKPSNEHILNRQYLLNKRNMFRRSKNVKLDQVVMRTFPILTNHQQRIDFQLNRAIKPFEECMKEQMRTENTRKMYNRRKTMYPQFQNPYKQIQQNKESGSSTNNKEIQVNVDLETIDAIKLGDDAIVQTIPEELDDPMSNADIMVDDIVQVLLKECCAELTLEVDFECALENSRQHEENRVISMVDQLHFVESIAMRQQIS